MTNRNFELGDEKLTIAQLQGCCSPESDRFEAEVTALECLAFTNGDHGEIMCGEDAECTAAKGDLTGRLHCVTKPEIGESYTNCVAMFRASTRASASCITDGMGQKPEFAGCVGVRVATQVCGDREFDAPDNYESCVMNKYAEVSCALASASDEEIDVDECKTETVEVLPPDVRCTMGFCEDYNDHADCEDQSDEYATCVAAANTGSHEARHVCGTADGHPVFSAEYNACVLQKVAEFAMRDAPIQCLVDEEGGPRHLDEAGDPTRAYKDCVAFMHAAARCGLEFDELSDGYNACVAAATAVPPAVVRCAFDFDPTVGNNDDYTACFAAVDGCAETYASRTTESFVDCVVGTVYGIPVTQRCALDLTQEDIDACVVDSFAATRCAFAFAVGTDEYASCVTASTTDPDNYPPPTRCALDPETPPLDDALNLNTEFTDCVTAAIEEVLEEREYQGDDGTDDDVDDPTAKTDGPVDPGTETGDDGGNQIREGDHELNPRGVEAVPEPENEEETEETDTTEETEEPADVRSGADLPDATLGVEVVKMNEGPGEKSDDNENTFMRFVNSPLGIATITVVSVLVIGGSVAAFAYFNGGGFELTRMTGAWKGTKISPGPANFDGDIEMGGKKQGSNRAYATNLSFNPKKAPAVEDTEKKGNPNSKKPKPNLHKNKVAPAPYGNPLENALGGAKKAPQKTKVSPYGPGLGPKFGKPGFTPWTPSVETQQNDSLAGFSQDSVKIRKSFKKGGNDV